MIRLLWKVTKKWGLYSWKMNKRQKIVLNRLIFKKEAQYNVKKLLKKIMMGIRSKFIIWSPIPIHRTPCIKTSTSVIKLRIKMLKKRLMTSWKLLKYTAIHQRQIHSWLFEKIRMMLNDYSLNSLRSLIILNIEKERWGEHTMFV